MKQHGNGKSRDKWRFSFHGQIIYTFATSHSYVKMTSGYSPIWMFLIYRWMNSKRVFLLDIRGHHLFSWRQLVASGASAAIFPLDNLSPYSEFTVYCGLEHFLFFHIYCIGNVIIPTDFHIFRGVGIPPTSLQYFTISCRIVSPCWTTILDCLISMCGYVHVWVLYTNGPCSIGYIQ